MDMGGGRSWESVSDRRAPLPSWVRAGALLVALMLVSSLVYWWWQRPRHPVLAHEAAPASSTAPPAPAPQAVLPATPPPAVNPAPTTAVAPPEATPAAAGQAPVPQNASSGAPAVTLASQTPAAQTSAVASPAPNPNATVRVSITATEPVWVRADVNGKYQFSGTLQPNESRNIDGDGQVTLRLGNAGGVMVTLNGKPVGPVGPKGQVRTVQFTANGFQVTAPSVDSLDRL